MAGGKLEGKTTNEARSGAKSDPGFLYTPLKARKPVVPNLSVESDHGDSPLAYFTNSRPFVLSSLRIIALPELVGVKGWISMTGYSRLRPNVAISVQCTGCMTGTQHVDNLGSANKER